MRIWLPIADILEKVLIGKGMKSKTTDEIIILDEIPLRVEFEGLASRLRLKDETRVRAKNLLDEVPPLMVAKAVYRACCVELRSDGGVTIGGVHWKSKVLHKRLEQVGRVFVYVVTIGSGLEEKGLACPDALDKYYLDEIGNSAVVKARDFLKEHLQSRYRLKGLSTLGPGQLGDWPLETQRPLFSLLGDVQHTVGVRLTESLLMRPAKSLSGIFFPTETTFFACQLCPREKCPSRKAKYNEELAEEYGLK
jgi:hypothetical protein